MSEGALTITAAGVIMYANRRFAEMLQRPLKGVIGSTIHTWIAPDNLPILQSLLRKDTDEKRSEQLVLTAGDGTQVPVNLSVSNLPSSEICEAFCLVATDLTEQKRAEEELREANDALLRLATTDALTGIANRRAFDEYLEREWKRMLREKMPLSLILCDIDYFKKYNDLYGHQAGDSCLHDVAQALHKCIFRPGDFVARYGGEEFVVILPGTPAEGALHIAEHIRSAVRELIISHAGSEVDQFVTLSLGVAQEIPSMETNTDDLLRAADTALYKAKKQGRNRVIVAETKMQRRNISKNESTSLPTATAKTIDMLAK
jgi:diguanylate cyclase (GGDEF)-like protein/PAS domain S-box-containing protein